MPSLRDIRKRIGSVKNTQKITRAMKMVAASKLRRAQHNLINATHYMDAYKKILGELSKSVDFTSSPLGQKRETKNTLLILMTGDKGLCGSFNTNLIAMCERMIKEYQNQGHRITLTTIGKKGQAFAKKLTVELKDSFSIDQIFKENITPSIATSLITDFLENKFDMVSIVYGHFNSAISNTAKAMNVLPLTIENNEIQNDREPLFEPTKKEVLKSFLEHLVHHTFYTTLVHTFVSEISSRMIAMDSATNNAKDLIGKLTLDFNRKRQASITKEMLEIIGGKEALTN